MLLIVGILSLVVVLGAFGIQCYNYRKRKHGAHD
jgi:hypothetical protein